MYLHWWKINDKVFQKNIQLISKLIITRKNYIHLTSMRSTSFSGMRHYFSSQYRANSRYNSNNKTILLHTWCGLKFMDEVHDTKLNLRKCYDANFRNTIFSLQTSSITAVILKALLAVPSRFQKRTRARDLPNRTSKWILDPHFRFLFYSSTSYTSSNKVIETMRIKLIRRALMHQKKITGL